MKIHFTKIVDLYLGGLICFLLSVFSPRRAGRVPGDIKRILVIKILGLGSIIVMTPMLRSLRKRYPGAEVDFLTRKEHRALIDLYRLADSVYSVDMDTFPRFLRSSLSAVGKLRRRRYDLVIDAEFYSKYTAILSWLIRPKSIAGFHSPDIYRGSLREIRVYFNAYRHMTENFLELALQVGAESEPTGLTKPRISSRAMSAVRGLLRDSNVDCFRPYVLLNPHASEVTPQIDRRWPLEYFRKLALALRAGGYQVIVIDSPGQSDHTGQLARTAAGAITRLRTEVDLEGLAALCRGAFCLVTNDSGPLHLAVSMGTPTFSFFGTETPLLYGYDFPPHTIFYERLACSPCLSVFNFKIGRCEFGVRCLRRITPEKVMASFSRQEGYLRDYWLARRERGCRPGEIAPGPATAVPT